MPDLTVVRSSNAAFKPTYVPVAIFVGGTSGVGEATLNALASYTGGNVHLFIIGRNKAAAEKTFASIPQPSSDILREFLYCDALLMKNVASACDEIRQKVNKINYLVLSAGWIKFTSRDETEEGLDKMLAIRFYERFKFIRELLPLLHHAVDEGEQASVLSILGSKSSPPLNLDDLEMKKSYRSFKAAAYSGAYGDIMVEGFAKRNPAIAFTHIFPGFVNTPQTNQLYSYWPALLLYPIIQLAKFFLAISPAESAEYMLYALLETKPGWARKDEKANDIGPTTYSEEEKEMVWEHAISLTA